MTRGKLRPKNTGSAGPNIDSARANLAGSFVNAFVNAGFGNDKLMVEVGEGEGWVYKNKDHGMLSAADRKSTRLNSSHSGESRMPSSA